MVEAALRLMLLAWAIELTCDYPGWLVARIGHPVMAMGALIAALDARIDRGWTAQRQKLEGVALCAICVGAATGSGLLIAALLPANWWGTALEALIASSLIATRSLHDHVREVAAPLASGDLPAARAAVAMIVGRDTASLDEAEVASAALETLGENASDGVIAPLFWGCLFGLPGLAAYKMINTLDSMVGHRSPRHLHVGWASARLDDLANLIPARLTAALIGVAGGQFGESWRVMATDAPAHRSPNGGWPEAALAGALGVRLSGPRLYHGQRVDEPWLNATGASADAHSLLRGLRLYRRAMGLGFGALSFMLLAALWLVVSQ